MATKNHCVLRWNNFSQHLSVALEKLRTNDDFVDVSLLCEGRRIKAHKVVLSSSSNYFKDIFKDNQHPHPTVILNLIKFNDLKSIVEFMYQGEIVVKEESMQSFLQTAEMLCVQGLVSDDKDKINLSMNAPLELESVIKSLPKTITTTITPIHTFESHELNNLNFNEIDTDENLNAWSSTPNSHRESKIELTSSAANVVLIKENKSFESSAELSSDPLDVLKEESVSLSPSIQKSAKPKKRKRASNTSLARSNVFKIKMEHYKKHVIFEKYFQIIDLGDKDNEWNGMVVDCRFCNKRLRGSTCVSSNFLRHLKLNHSDVFESYISEKLEKKEKSVCSNTSTNDETLASN